MNRPIRRMVVPWLLMLLGASGQSLAAGFSQVGTTAAVSYAHCNWLAGQNVSQLAGASWRHFRSELGSDKESADDADLGLNLRWRHESALGWGESDHAPYEGESTTRGLGLTIPRRLIDPVEVQLNWARIDGGIFEDHFDTYGATVSAWF